MNKHLAALALTVALDHSSDPILITENLAHEWFKDITISHFCSVYDFESWPVAMIYTSVKSFQNDEPAKPVATVRRYIAFKLRPEFDPREA